MILMVVALHCEAKPFIKHFNLKKSQSSHRLDLYTGEESSLIVSGTGMLKCAVAATYLLSRFPPSEITCMLNTGICGSVSRDIPIGTAVLFNKITNNDTGRSFFPDMLIKTSLPEGSLRSFSFPVTTRTTVDPSDGFVDMEAAGFMESAATFLPPHKVFCIKTVSDHLEGTRLTPDFAARLMEDSLPAVTEIISAASKVNRSRDDILSPSDYGILETIAANLKFTETLKHQFKNAALRYKIRSGKNLDCLVPFTGIQVESKREGKAVFEDIRAILDTQ